VTFRIARTNVNKNPFIGLFMRANDSILLVSPRLQAATIKEAAGILDVKPLSIFVDESPYLGLFSALNSNGCVLPRLCTERETRALKKAGLNVCSLASPHAPGNTILCNDNAALASPAIPKKEAKRAADALGVEVLQQSFGGLASFAATSAVTNRGLLTYNDLTEAELKHLEKLFKVHAVIGTTNFGVPYNSLSVVANSRGALAGDKCTGFEMQRVFEAFS